MGELVIVDGRRIGVADGNHWRRGRVISEPKMLFGKRQVQVRLERRGREVAPREVWQPMAWLLKRKPELEAKLAERVHGHDDA